ncbi:hypothetical protein Tco_1359548 [Tanacetum coccineum]
MMNLTTLLKIFWGYALESATRILNMVPTKKVKRTPYEIWHGKAPKLSYLRVWGCEALVKRDTIEKLDPRSIKCIFFFENRLMVQEASGSHGLLESSGSDGGLELIQEEDTQPSENTSEIHNEVAPIERKSNEILDENAKKKVQSCMQLDVLDLMLPLSKIRVKPEAELKVSCYADASFQLDENDTKSQTGYVINGICLDNNYLDGLECLMPSNKRPMEMLCDNEPAIAIANDPGILKGARHFQRKYHYIREVFKNLIAMASKQRSSRPILHEMTLGTLSLVHMPQPPSPTLFVPPTRIGWDTLFQQLFDEYFNPPSSVDHPVLEVAASELVVSTGLMVMLMRVLKVKNGTEASRAEMWSNEVNDYKLLACFYFGQEIRNSSVTVKASLTEWEEGEPD